VAVVLAVLHVAERRSEKRRLPATIIVAIVALAVGISSIVQLYRVGDTGRPVSVGQRNNASETGHRKVGHRLTLDERGANI
jgi:hypothetical protein